MGRDGWRGLLLGVLLLLRAVPAAAVEGTCASPTFIPSSGGVFTGTTSGTSALTQNCGTTGSAPESVFTWTPAVSGTAVLTTIHSGFDTVLAVETQCGVGTTTLASGCGNDGASCCGDCNGGAGLWDSTVTVAVTAGVPLYVIVDGDGSCSASTCTDRNQGPYRLVVTPPGVSTTTVPACASTTTTTTLPAVPPPPYPGNLRVNTISCGSQPTVRITWSPSVPLPGGNAIQGYIIIKWNGVTGHMDTDACAASCVGLGTGPNDACCRYCTGGTQSGAACLTGADCPGVGGGTCQGRGFSGVLNTSSYPNLCSGGTCTFTETLGAPGPYYYAVIAYDTANQFSPSPTTCSLPYTGGGGVCGPNLFSGCDAFPCFQCSYSGSTPYNGLYCDGHPNDCGNPAHSECAVCVPTTTTTLGATTTTAVSSTTTTTLLMGSVRVAKRLTTTSGHEAKAIAVDTRSNCDGAGGTNCIIVSGYFSNTTIFDGTSLTGTANGSIFLAKYKSNGTLLWAKTFAGNGTDTPNRVAVDSNGNIALTGAFWGTLNFGGSDLVSVNNSNDIFVAKLTASGTHIWSQRFGNANSEAGLGLAFDSAGNVLLAGAFQGAVDFGCGTLTSTPNGNIDAVLAKYTAAAPGACIWSKNFPSTADDSGNAVAVDTHTNCDGAGGTDCPVLTGGFNGSMNLTGGTATGAGSLASNGFLDIYVGKFKSDGTHVWSKRFGGATDDSGTAVAVDGIGNVAVTGFFHLSVNFGGGTLTADNNINNGFADGFALGLAGATGNYAWAQRFGGQDDDLGTDVTTDGSGNVIVAGRFQSIADFSGGGSASSNGLNDMCLVKYTSTGSLVWVRPFGKTNEDFALALAADGAGDVDAVGYFWSSSVTFGSTVVTNPGTGTEPFLLQLAP